ncbi:hypothetical protein MTR_4g102105 [Medicago truncatula]|uniref:Uncharacterized protein n=1 Tax=Medicago truncatula TaxID=3880 RepID=A0A072UQN5_MEDTR|nr:hypothetical protein MTR_4g102105 [Medicago truncatula]
MKKQMMQSQQNRTPPRTYTRRPEECRDETSSISLASGAQQGHARRKVQRELNFIENDSNKEHYPPFVMPKKMTNFKWVLGVRFGTKDEFKEAITNYAIYNRTCLKRFKN